MMRRTVQSVARFAFPFRLDAFDAVQPAGEYRVEADEELVEGISWLAWRRLATIIHLPAIGSENSTRQMVPTSRLELYAALENDRSQASRSAVEPTPALSRVAGARGGLSARS